MKKKIVSFILVFSFLFTVGFANQSMAIVGMATGNPGVIATGAVIAGLGLVGGTLVVTGVAKEIYDEEEYLFPTKTFLTGVVSVVLAPLGIIILNNDESNNIFKFATISDDSCSQFNLNQDECVAFNNERDIINTVTEEIGCDMSGSGDYSPFFAKERWLFYQDAISEDSFTALTKIAVYAIREAGETAEK